MPNPDHGGRPPADRPPTDPPPVAFVDGGPLGGRPQRSDEPTRPSDRRDVVLTAFLLVAAVAVGVASLMPWRDFGRRFGASAVETGWVRLDGSLGRGWVVVLLGVGLAVAGVLIAAGRGVAGRRLAVVAGVASSVVAIAEWGVGTAGVRAGPGLGLWLLLGLGVAVVIAVGNLTPGRGTRAPSGPSS